MKRIVIVALLFVFGLAGVACGGSKQKKADKTAAEQRRAQSKAAKDKTEVEEPTQKELSKSPCGNPRWAKLPEGAESKAEGTAKDNDPTDESTDRESDQAGDSDEQVKDGEGDC